MLYLTSDFPFFFKIQLTFQTWFFFDKPQSASISSSSESTYLSVIFLNEANKLKIKMSIGIIQHISSHEGATSFATLLYSSDVPAMLIKR